MKKNNYLNTHRLPLTFMLIPYDSTPAPHGSGNDRNRHRGLAITYGSPQQRGMGYS